MVNNWFRNLYFNLVQVTQFLPKLEKGSDVHYIYQCMWVDEIVDPLKDISSPTKWGWFSVLQDAAHLS